MILVRKLAVGVWMVLVLPWLGVVITNQLVDHAGLVNVVWFVGAIACILMNLAIAQGTGMLWMFRRLLRFVTGGDAYEPLSPLERALMAGPPLVLAPSLFLGLGGLVWLVGAGPPALVWVWTLLGGVYGLTLAVGIYTGDLDPQDADPLDVYPDDY